MVNVCSTAFARCKSFRAHEQHAGTHGQLRCQSDLAGYGAAAHEDNPTRADRERARCASATRFRRAPCPADDDGGRAGCRLWRHRHQPALHGRPDFHALHRRAARRAALLRADNHGEGGILALASLAAQAVAERPALRGSLLLLGVAGATLFYGDGVITPAISEAVRGDEPRFRQRCAVLRLPDNAVVELGTRVQL